MIPNKSNTSRSITIGVGSLALAALGYFVYKNKKCDWSHESNLKHNNNKLKHDTTNTKTNNPKVIAYMACTIDGFIARKDGSVDFLDKYNNPDTNNDNNNNNNNTNKTENSSHSESGYDYNTFYNTVSTVIIGRKTFEQVLTFDCDFPHNNKQCYVLSKTKTSDDYKHLFKSKKIDSKKLHFYNCDTNINENRRDSIQSIHSNDMSLKDLIEQIKTLNQKNNCNNIYCDGGMIVSQLTDLGLIDEYYIFIVPELIGNGILLFQNVKQCLLKMKSCIKHKSGIVELKYSRE